MADNADLLYFLSANKLDKALAKFGDLELSIEDGSVRCNSAQLSWFYSVYMLTYLTNQDLNGGKYLWKRSSQSLKNRDSFPVYCEIWNIGKFLWHEDFKSAFTLINSFNWPGEISPYIGNLKDVLIRSQLSMFASAYTTVSLEVVAAHLAMSKQDTLNCKLKFFFILHGSHF